jgi:hypothetical protein
MRFFVAVVLVICALGASDARELQQPAAAALTSNKGTITIVGRPRNPLIDQQLAGFAAAAALTPEPMSQASTANALTPAAAAVPAATATIKLGDQQLLQAGLLLAQPLTLLVTVR